MQLVEIKQSRPHLEKDGVLVGDVFEVVPMEGHESVFLLGRKINGNMDAHYQNGTRWIYKRMVNEVNESDL